MTARVYSSPPAFKHALEQRLKTASKDGVDFARRRQLLVFERFLARVSAVFGDAILLKGGLVLELRLERARTTKDIDLRVTGSPENVLATLQQAGRQDLGDFMTFEVGPDPEQPTIENDGMQYEGLRFRAECRLAGKIYGQRFGVDVAFGDPIFGEADIVTADDVLDFAGIAPPTLRLYPIETHIAEKLHAYTMPRTRMNTRVKDLPDIALLAGIQPLQATRLRKALEQTFTHRATHPVPHALPNPPASWSTSYQQMARENELAWPTLEELTTAVSTFMNPILADASGAWNPAGWRWD
jgi:predicted nucleotidyltransferase component of viral defense system